MTHEYGGDRSQFNARVQAAIRQLESGTLPHEVREKHGAIVLREAQQELVLKLTQRRLSTR